MLLGKLTVMKARWFLLFFAALLAGSSLSAQEPWQDKPYTDWTYEELLQLGKDSPWARETQITIGSHREYAGTETVTVPVYNRYGGIVGYTTRTRPKYERVYTREQVVVQWASSLTLRQARVRQGEFKETMTPERRAELLEANNDSIIISVRGSYIRSFLRQYLNPPPGLAARSVFLQTNPGKHRIPAADMQFFTAGEPEDLLLGDPVVWFFFPREIDGRPTISPNESSVEFKWMLGEFDLQDIGAKFDLRKMVRDGQRDF